jgi:uncharacterized protein (DUF433 family)
MGDAGSYVRLCAVTSIDCMTAATSVPARIFRPHPGPHHHGIIMYEQISLTLRYRLKIGCAVIRVDMMTEADLLARITVNPKIFGGKPIIRGHRIAVEHVLGMLAAGDTPQAILEAYPYLEAEDIQACLVFARRLVARERVEPVIDAA